MPPEETYSHDGFQMSSDQQKWSTCCVRPWSLKSIFNLNNKVFCQLSFKSCFKSNRSNYIANLPFLTVALASVWSIYYFWSHVVCYSRCCICIGVIERDRLFVGSMWSSLLNIVCFMIVVWMQFCLLDLILFKFKITVVTLEHAIFSACMVQRSLCMWTSWFC